MALVIKDRVQETTTTTGTGTLTLSGALIGYSSFSVIGNANTTYYCIFDPATGAWEAGIGTYTASGTTLSRDTVYANSLGTTALINFGAGQKFVFGGMPANKTVYLDSTGNVSPLGTVTSGTWSASFGAVSGANLTNLTAGNLTGTIPSGVLGNSTAYVGTTAVALNRASANQGLTGITSIAMPGGTSGTITITPAATAGTTALTIPANSGSFVTTGDTGTVTNTMLAGSIANSKLTNSSVTINGSAVSLGGSITVTATASNALTIGSYLTGGSYNGSAAVTIAADATSANTASKLVARDASGNFSAGTITANLTGTASTATTSTTQAKSDVSTNIATTAFSKNLFVSPSTSGTLDWNDNTNCIPGVGPTLLLGTATNGPGGGNYYHPFNINYNVNDGTGNGTQMAVAYGSPANELYMRGRYSASWSSWVRFLNSSNYNSYAPTLTGTGASGTWGINVTGSAGSASTATTATNATNVAITDDVATATSVYISWVGATSGNTGVKLSSTKLTMVPSTGTVTSAGNFVANSDESLKANWRPVQDDFVTKLSQVKSGVYDRVDVDLTQAGVSAQSLQLVLPETVQKSENGILSVAYGNAALVSAVELAKEVVALRQEIAELKAKIGG